MKDVMVDLETLGNKPGCIILSIGAVFFDPLTGELGDTHYRVIRTAGQTELGLHEDEDTMKWWAAQAPAARQVLQEAQNSKFTLEESLVEFTDFVAKPGLGTVQVWGNGADFDNAILTVGYMATQRNIPWKFWNNRCFRTLKALCPELKMEKSLLAHNALNDAIMQAEHACKVFKALRGEA